MPNDFTPTFDRIEAGEPNVFARKMLVEFVKQYASHSGVSQRELAERCGMKQSSIARIFSHRFPPTLDTFLKIAGALSLHLDIRTK